MLLPKISVIIPVYNAGDGIKKCLDSLEKQTLKEVEFIFIDDCGTDQSMEIIEKAAAVDKRIRIIRNPYNIGAGNSRNVGIENATGEYLSFVDPDDYIEYNFLQLLYKKTKNKILYGVLITILALFALTASLTVVFDKETLPLFVVRLFISLSVMVAGFRLPVPVFTSPKFLA